MREKNHEKTENAINAIESQWRSVVVMIDVLLKKSNDQFTCNLMGLNCP